MEVTSVVTALSALSQEHRLAVFRQLVQAGEAGMAAGAIATALKPQNRSDVKRSCCSGQSDVAHVLEAGLESFPASDAPDWTLGRESRNSYCCAGGAETKVV